jgi:DNA-binding ferritin-like protein
LAPAANSSENAVRGNPNEANLAKKKASTDLLKQRMQVHEQTAWILRALLEK